MIHLEYPKFHAVFSEKGGQLLSCKFEGQEDLFYLSGSANLEGSEAIRGGIPICWPWFGPDDKGGPSHGFVRNMDWHFGKAVEKKGIVSISAKVDVKKQLEDILLEVLYTFDPDNASIEIALKTTNNSETTFALTQALHTYFNIGAIDQVVIEGLEDKKYFDKLDEKIHFQKGPLKFDKETDNIFYTRDKISIIDKNLKRTILVENVNSNTAVVWNPWIEKESRIIDMVKNDYKKMCCVESANVMEDKVLIEANEIFILSTKISIIR